MVIGGDVPAQLQSLISGVIHLAALSPPTVILARDKFKLHVHGSTLDDLPNLQNGLAFSEKLLRENTRFGETHPARPLARAPLFIARMNAAARKSWPSFLSVDLNVALESYRLARPAFTTNGLATDKEVEEFLRADAEVLKLKEPVPAAKIFRLQPAAGSESGIGYQVDA